LDGHTYTLQMIQLQRWIEHRDGLLAQGEYLEHDAACRTVNRLRRQAATVLEHRMRKTKAKTAKVPECPVAASHPVFLTRDEALGRAVRYGGNIVAHQGHWHVAADADRIYRVR
jgi:hypothetical protein